MSSFAEMVCREITQNARDNCADQIWQGNKYFKTRQFELNDLRQIAK